MILVGDIMSLGEKILKLRKKEGLSQEELGTKINVTRQTISNWELNETSPNTEQLKSLSKEFNISIDELLDNDIKNVIDEKVSSNLKLTKIMLMLIKILVIIVVVFLLLILTKIVVKSSKDYGRKITETIHCKLYGEEHSYGIEYYELTGEPISLGGDAYFSDILDLGKYNDAHQIFNIINDYVKKNGGTCSMIWGENIENFVSVEIKEGTLSKTGLTLIIREDIDYDIEYGEEFYLEKYDYETNTYNRLVENPNSNCGFNMPAYSVTPEKPLELKQDWSCQYGELDKGLYRIVKSVFFASDTPINGNNIFYISQEFLIN